MKKDLSSLDNNTFNKYIKDANDLRFGRKVKSTTYNKYKGYINPLEEPMDHKTNHYLEWYFVGVFDALANRCKVVSLNWNKNRVKIFITIKETEHNLNMLRLFMLRIGGEILSLSDNMIQLSFNKKSEIHNVLALFASRPVLTTRGRLAMNDIKNCILNPNHVLQVTKLDESDSTSFPLFKPNVMNFRPWLFGFLEIRGRFLDNYISLRTDNQTADYIDSALPDIYSKAHENHVSYRFSYDTIRYIISYDGGCRGFLGEAQKHF